MSSDEIELSAQEQERDEVANAQERIPATKSDRTVDARDLARTEGYPADVREAVESPMVAPEMLNAPGDLRGDTMDED